MPFVRLLGNSILSLINKVVNGYWNTMDPTNGYTAIHRHALQMLNLEKIANDYFFESDMLFRLGTIRAVIDEVPIQSRYEDEKSSLNILKVIFKFPIRYFNRFCKRIFYNYFLRDFNVGTIELIAGIILLLFGMSSGSYFWYQTYITEVATTSGQVMIAALPVILGFQLLLSVVQYDISNIPKKPLVKK